MDTNNPNPSNLPDADLVSRISYHHNQASLKASEAIFHAKEAGRLLIELKAKLVHGEFGKWIADNLNVSKRQAQRYMETAQGKKPKPEDKSDMVSHFPAKKQKKAKPPLWTPKAGFAYSGIWDGGSYSVDPVLGSEGMFHVVLLKSERTPIEDGGQQIGKDTEFQGSIVTADQVEATLQELGLAEPGKLFWTVHQYEGEPKPWWKSKP